MDTSNLPGWLAEQIAVREAEDMAGRREAYDEWARNYADSGVRVEGADETVPGSTP